MAEKTEISWTDATFNPWWGCAKVSPACDHCYAERDSRRFAAGKVLWGVDAERRVFGDKHWNAPARWDATAGKLGRRVRVFCASMADVFDKNAPEGARERLWALIEATPNLDWQLLTKRISNVFKMVPARWRDDGFPSNVWMGATVVNQEELDRDGPRLAAVPARVRFLSIEPMLGRMDLSDALVAFNGINWVIAGGESGPHARDGETEWYRQLAQQCKQAGVPFHLKQITVGGKKLPMGVWPSDLQVQEFPR